MIKNLIEVEDTKEKKKMHTSKGFTVACTQACELKNETATICNWSIHTTGLLLKSLMPLHAIEKLKSEKLIEDITYRHNQS